MKNTTHQEFLEQYNLIHASFVRYCSSKAYGIMQAEDLVQEAILAALKNFGRLQEQGKLLAYLIGTVRNILSNHRRQAKFKGAWDEHLLQQLESRAPSPEVAMDIHILLQAIEQLPEKQREAVVLFEISGFSIKEISELQYSSEAATKTRLSRARQNLRKKLNDQVHRPSLASTLAAYASILF